MISPDFDCTHSFTEAEYLHGPEHLRGLEHLRVCGNIPVGPIVLILLLLLYYIQRKIFFRATIFLYSPCPNLEGIETRWIADMSWIRVLDTPSCYECGAIVWPERKSVRPLAPLVRTVEQCAQRRSANAHVHQRLASHGNHSCSIFKILSLRSS